MAFGLASTRSMINVLRLSEKNLEKIIEQLAT